jgi:hypothetical protein
MRRLTVLSLPPKLVFPGIGLGVSQSKDEIIKQGGYSPNLLTMILQSFLTSGRLNYIKLT